MSENESPNDPNSHLQREGKEGGEGRPQLVGPWNVPMFGGPWKVPMFSGL